MLLKLINFIKNNKIISLNMRKVNQFPRLRYTDLRVIRLFLWPFTEYFCEIENASIKEELIS